MIHSQLDGLQISSSSPVPTTQKGYAFPGVAARQVIGAAPVAVTFSAPAGTDLTELWLQNTSTGGQIIEICFDAVGVAYGSGFPLLPGDKIIVGPIGQSGGSTLPIFAVASAAGGNLAKIQMKTGV